MRLVGCLLYLLMILGYRLSYGDKQVPVVPSAQPAVTAEAQN